MKSIDKISSNSPSPTQITTTTTETTTVVSKSNIDEALEARNNEKDRFLFRLLILLVIALLLPLFWSLTTKKLTESSSKQILLILSSLIVSIISYFVCILLIPKIAEKTQKNNLWGNDVNKIERPVIPESLGVVPGTVYVVSVCVIQLFMVSIFSSASAADENLIRMFFENNGGLFTSCFMLFLGFADDVLDLRWRYKLILPSLCALPLIVGYQGSTTVILPKFMKKLPFFDKILNYLSFLGIEEMKWVPPVAAVCLNLKNWYKVYMGMLALFCSNAINILAGINGLETSQAVIIGVSCAIHNIIEIKRPYSLLDMEDKSIHHLFSLICMLPFIATSMALLEYNWYPSKFFVGDTFTYFSGMTLATCGILGHYSKTLILFFLPQILNFLISLPQLFGIVSCPRHRLPIINKETRKLHSSGNWNLINVTLLLFGPMSERALSGVMALFQIICCIFAFFVRYWLFVEKK